VAAPTSNQGTILVILVIPLLQPQSTPSVFYFPLINHLLDVFPQQPALVRRCWVRDCIIGPYCGAFD
jgi:hypothetical protein